ncbi:hypothetical protein CTEN210_05931 [Chaetoceros tenuissimus]|uniref:Uncharacterized protein n=1 Tax=Chaetoceros tenuissimus TaxID=426638 RepID=A0AAD3CRD6_9STRA|nr:hypothetical protein CTEN210_05931 [Chaetoceros tenuissimus]
MHQSKRKTQIGLSSILILSIFLSPPTTHSLSSSSNPSKKVQICQNKDCCKSFPAKYDGGLYQAMRDLLPNQQARNEISIEKSGCLSHCNRGPNVNIVNKDNEERSERMFGRIDGILAGAVALDVGLGIDCPGELMAALESMASAHQASDPIKKIKLLNSTIHTITQAQLTTSTAMAHALILRADAFLEAGQAQNYKQAMEDVTKAISIDDLDGRAWRVLADVKEAQEDYLGAMEAISEWAVVNPEFQSKAQKELTRIMAKKAQLDNR